MKSRRLVLAIIQRSADATALANELNSLGVAAFVTSKTWDGELRDVVGYHAVDARQAALMEAALESLQIEAEVILEDLPGDERLTPVFSSFSSEEAHLMANLLERSGLQTKVVADQVSYMVLVCRSAEPTALAVVSQFFESRNNTASTASTRPRSLLAGALAIAAGATPAGDDEIPHNLHAWPCCPKCSKPRDTRCPKCRETGSHFPAAEMVPDDFENDHPSPSRLGPSPWPVICPLCDWLFEPQHYRRCAWCGHDFENGIEAPRIRQVDEVQLNARMALVAIGILALIAGILIYLVVIGRGRNQGADSQSAPRRSAVANHNFICVP